MSLGVAFFNATFHCKKIKLILKKKRVWPQFCHCTYCWWRKLCTSWRAIFKMYKYVYTYIYIYSYTLQALSILLVSCICHNLEVFLTCQLVAGFPSTVWPFHWSQNPWRFEETTDRLLVPYYCWPSNLTWHQFSPGYGVYTESFTRFHTISYGARLPSSTNIIFLKFMYKKLFF